MKEKMAATKYVFVLLDTVDRNVTTVRQTFPMSIYIDHFNHLRCIISLISTNVSKYFQMLAEHTYATLEGIVGWNMIVQNVTVHLNTMELIAKQVSNTRIYDFLNVLNIGV